MKKTKRTLILTQDDYQIMTHILNGGWGKTSFDMKLAEDLRAELKKARVVDEKDVPGDVVRINSKVRIKADDRNEEMELMVVTPDRANLKEKRVSLLAPIGTALIGFRKGQQVKWKVPSGNKTFTILDVINEDVKHNHGV
jgi:regulator of nucleoside diphosphate kinase